MWSGGLPRTKLGAIWYIFPSISQQKNLKSGVFDDRLFLKFCHVWNGIDQIWYFVKYWKIYWLLIITNFERDTNAYVRKNSLSWNCSSRNVYLDIGVLLLLYKKVKYSYSILKLKV